MVGFRVGNNVLRIGLVAAMMSGCGGGSGSLNPPPTGPSTALRVTTAERARPAVAYEVLYSFAGGSGDGEYPRGALILCCKSKGTLYGTTFRGGANGLGTVFSVTTSGAESVLHSFGGSGDGQNPDAGLHSVDRTLYGTTYAGGVNGYGAVFSLTPSGTEIVLHSFGGSGDGENPTARLIVCCEVKSTLYGTTDYGGTDDEGMVFSVTTSGTETVLHSFDVRDGQSPTAALVKVNRTLYGTTVLGGAQGYGTVFSVTTSGAETVLHSFGGSGDGENPYAELLKIKGTLYGTTLLGGAQDYGTVFSVTTSGTETVLHSFKGGSADGELPYAGLVKVKGTLYGTTDAGGTNGKGTVFSITPSGSETVLHSFGGSGDGENPMTDLVNVRGTLYGTTSAGGANGYGTVFSLKP